MRGIDISNWQEGLTLENVAGQIDFAIMKATEGTDFVDWCCDSWVQECKHLNLKWGFYHFAGHGDPQTEARFFYSNCQNYFHDGIPVLDYEVDNSDNTAWCEAFMNELHELSGVWAVLYISAYRCIQYAGSWLPKYCGLWVAGYPYGAVTWSNDPMPYNISPWAFCIIWQFTSSLRLSGYSGNLDGNVSYIDEREWNLYADSSQDATPAPEPEPEPRKTYIDLAREVILGEWGNGSDRYRLLTEAGYDYFAVQDTVNMYLRLAYEIID